MHKLPHWPPHVGFTSPTMTAPSSSSSQHRFRKARFDSCLELCSSFESSSAAPPASPPRSPHACAPSCSSRIDVCNRAQSSSASPGGWRNGTAVSALPGPPPSLFHASFCFGHSTSGCDVGKLESPARPTFALSSVINTRMLSTKGWRRGLCERIVARTGRSAVRTAVTDLHLRGSCYARRGHCAAREDLRSDTPVVP